jgi:hypothetical protein
MDTFLVFSNFDIVAYLMVGLSAFIVLDIVLSQGFLFRTKWNTGSVTGIIIFAYLMGHLVSIPSRAIFETWAERSCLGGPVGHLVSEDSKDQTERKCRANSTIHRFPDIAADSPSPSAISSFLCKAAIKPIVRCEYFEPATQDVLDRIVPSAHSRDASSFYNSAFVLARHDPNSYERMDIFQRLSILFRNMTFLAFAALLLVLLKSAMLPFGIRWADEHLIYYGVQRWMLKGWFQTLFFLALTVGLLDRYLFFHRLFALEAITSFAYSPPPIVE